MRRSLTHLRGADLGNHSNNKGIIKNIILQKAEKHSKYKE